MKKRLQAAKATYETYEKWYDAYASKFEMSSKKYDEKEFNKWYRDAKAEQRKQPTAKDRKNYMRNFSQILARKQRQASELQLHVTYTAAKRQIKEFKKQKRLTERALLRQEIRREITGGKEVFGKEEIERVEREVNKRLRAGGLEKQRAAAKEATDKKLSKQINIINTYENMTYKEFRRQQKQVLRDIEEIVGDRSVWNEAFNIYYERLLKRAEESA